MTTNNLPFTSDSGFCTTGNVVGGNITTCGAVSATGNVTGQYLIGNLTYAISPPPVFGNTIAIGTGTGNAQGTYAIAIGNGAGNLSQSGYAVAIGAGSGQGNNAVNNSVSTTLGSPILSLLGTTTGAWGVGQTITAPASVSGAKIIQTRIKSGACAGKGFVVLSQNATSNISGAAGAAIGFQQSNAIAIGASAGSLNQNICAIAIGNSAGSSGQLCKSVAIGAQAGRTVQGAEAVAVGYGAGNYLQSCGAVAIGACSGKNAQGTKAVAIGFNSGNGFVTTASALSSGTSTLWRILNVCCGHSSACFAPGMVYQGRAVPFGNVIYPPIYITAVYPNNHFSTNRGPSVCNAQVCGPWVLESGTNAVAIGACAGHAQGNSSIAIGAKAGNLFLADNSIVINATGANLTSNVANALFVAPIRCHTVAGGSPVGLGYCTTTKEIVYGLAGGGGGCYGNSNVTTLLASGGVTTDIITTGNVYGNAIHTTAVTPGQVAFGDSCTTALVGSCNFVFSSNTSSLAVSGAIVGGCLNTAGNVSATGNIHGSIFNINGTIGGLATCSGLPALVANTSMPFSPGFVAAPCAVYVYGGCGVAPIYIGTQGFPIAVDINGNICGPGIMSVTGNVYGANVVGTYLYGCGANITGIAGSYGNSNVETLLASGAISTDILTTGSMSAQGNIFASTFSTVGAPGNITGANIISAVTFTATGNIYGVNLYGCGSHITGIPGALTGATTGCSTFNTTLGVGATVSCCATHSVALGSGASVSAINGIAIGACTAATNSGFYVAPVRCHTVAGGTPVGLGYCTTTKEVVYGLASGGSCYANANVAAYLSSGTVSTDILTTGNVSATGDVVGTNLYTTGNVSATGSVVGTNLYTAGVLSATGNVRGGNINTDGIVTATGNVYGANIVGCYLYGCGANITGLPNYYSNANVANYLPTYSGSLGSVSTITTTGNITIGGNAVIFGNLSVAGTTTFVNATSVTTSNLFLQLANNQNTFAGINGAGIQAGNVGNTYVANWTYSNVLNAWTTNVGISAAGTIAGNFNGSFTGCGRGITNLSQGRCCNSHLNYVLSTVRIGCGAGAGGFNNLCGGGIAIGCRAGQGGVGPGTILIGKKAGSCFSGQPNNIAIGVCAGTVRQGVNGSGYAIAIGSGAGHTCQWAGSIAIGFQAGATLQSQYGIAVGRNAGGISQGAYAVAIGPSAGFSSQGTNSIAIGRLAGVTNQFANAIAIGYSAGQTSQMPCSVAIGANAGGISQGPYAVAIGPNAGISTQGCFAIAIGRQAGVVVQRPYAVAIGYSAGQYNQGSSSIAIGYAAGGTAQTANGIAVGIQAGNFHQGAYTVAIGYHAGQCNQGNNAIAIGGFAGANHQPCNSIVINATGAAFTCRPATTNALYIAPVRSILGNASALQSLGYNTSTKEIAFGSVAVPSYTVTQAQAITPGSVGQMIAITDSATTDGKASNGMIAYWDTTNTRWSYISDNTAV